jgi:hypothetical protein
MLVMARVATSTGSVESLLDQYAEETLPVITYIADLLIDPTYRVDDADQSVIRRLSINCDDQAGPIWMAARYPFGSFEAVSDGTERGGCHALPGPGDRLRWNDCY